MKESRNVESFSLDHTKVRAPYVRLAGKKAGPKGDVVTKFDVRFAQPNAEYLPTGAIHTLEHLMAEYIRDELSGVIDLSPMGCRTGFYLLTRGLTPAQALQLTVDAYRFMADFDGTVPGASEVECGNYRDMDLPAAKAEAAAMLPVLEALTADQLHY